ncbi:MAG: BREX-1 system phosphatase PglZ type A [Methylococcaceae bacterium]|nr:BREX-1 system phosphatase PglZ type A [Methylococcaceae bacterium]
MQIQQLTEGINAKFKHSRLVFWYDPEKSFYETLPTLNIDGVTVLDMSSLSIFETKKRLEIDEPQQPFLLYFPYPEPEAEKDWLLDIRLYSEQFFADASSMLLNELGIPKMALREFIRSKQAFFANKQRFTALKNLVIEDENEQSLSLKMINVITKTASTQECLLQLISDYQAVLSAEKKTSEFMPLLEKFSLNHALWDELASQFCYQSDTPSIADFVLKLFCTELWSQIDSPERDNLLNNVLKTAAARAAGLAFMKNWRDSRNFSACYNALSQIIAQQLDFENQCKNYQPIQLLECQTFEVIEQSIIRGLVTMLLDKAKKLERGQFEIFIATRLGNHWCVARQEYAAIYQALKQAEQLFYLRSLITHGFEFDSVKAMYLAYEEELYQFDQSYRLFNEAVHSVNSAGADILRRLDEEVEKLYCHWYLYELGVAWDELLEKENSLQTWSIAKIPQQYDFYSEYVRAYLKAKQTKRIFVIISDALRYEVAQELAVEINAEKRFKAELSSQLGVLPSYTQLGMAALLPHQTLAYEADKGSAVFVDGLSSQGLENRHKILQKVNGMAVHFKTLMAWSNQEGRDKVRDAEVVYIYHDSIDAMGDKLATEEKTFAACRDAIDELKLLVTRVINRLGASRIALTADHGFLFQQQALTSDDKTVLTHKPVGTIEAKKRYIIGENLSAGAGCWKGRVAETAKASGDTEFLIPKAAQRFHFIGGARFVHGGAMLQEICVPVMSISELRGEKIKQHQKQAVAVVIASQPINIVNNIDKIRFIQTDAVGEKFIGRELDIFIIDAEGKEVSSRETVNFNSQNPSMDSRSREVLLKLLGAEFDRYASYTLVLEDTLTHTRYNHYAVTIDLAFQDDFF